MSLLRKVSEEHSKKGDNFVMICKFTAATSRGQRKDNQDNMRVDTLAVCVGPERERSFAGTFSDNKTHVFCVCDGIGGRLPRNFRTR